MSSDENSTTSNKRTRASGEALDFLLQEFEKNPNPSTEQRKDISSKTNMSEKAVRIWFQNRRAKLRKFERLNRLQTGGSSIHSSRSNSISNISPIHPNYGNQAIPIEINEKYCFVDCTSLSVGSWQRIKSGYHDERSLRNNLINLSPFTINSVMTSVDLLVILSKKNCEINYFFSAISNNSKILFRIFYPISSVATCSLLDNNITKENSELRVSLTHQPKFSVYFFNGINSQANQWSICDDFSEGQQVSQAYTSEGGTSIPHVLVGIKSSLQYLNSFIADNNNSTYSQFPTSMSGFSPLADFNSDTSPNSIGSTNSNQINVKNSSSHTPALQQHHSLQSFSNTPDFFTTLSGDGGQTPSNMLNHENSPSMNSQGHSNGVNSNTISIHAYTHQNNNHNDFLDSIQTFPSSHDFEFGLGGDLASNGETPLGGAFDGAPNGGNAAGNNNSSNNNNNATSGGTSSNVDSFIDFGSH
ncbi:regulatory protein [Scheffersomyces stipitis CBS 6054]|uniref:Regulatory protein n=1 Tax=Scheffersomyces stipitis (strain ATCC 58785 / CBS 6054 / NBRC 10063 / NRRL Y-11545) TaxID=322104 RepID=A3LNN4_PICST|nr:regulatory protein [Scheffersomyces stipitis CBS 6054]ABN64891.2 regulatory protein [Scheffersomyces stipitis CBS 6054]